MIGVYDFCGHYEWTFEWLRQRGGEELVDDYWVKAIAEDSQSHAWALIQKGFPGMAEYWGHTLVEEGAGYKTVMTDRIYRFDMHECPSKGFLIDNKLEQYHDYCDHCMGWIKPLMDRAGFDIHHEHNHCGRCWWEIVKKDDKTPPTPKGGLSADDVRNCPDWQSQKIDTFTNSQRKK
jgi:hypothetical protein